MQEFFIQLIKALATQIIGVFGIFFVFGYILSKLQQWTQRNYVRSIGWKGLYWTAWFGTPIHEWGHVFFAKLFRHKVHSIALFKPNRNTGGLGYTEHSYDSKSFYQSAGNFFVGAAPMIFGSVILFIMLYFLLPNGKEIFSTLKNGLDSFSTSFSSLQTFFKLLLSWENLRAWNFWLFLYLSFCIASHVAPSRPDQKQMWQGFFMIVIVLIVINILFLLLKIDITAYVLKINQYLTSLTVIFVYTIIISTLHWFLSAILLRPFRK